MSYPTTTTLEHSNFAAAAGNRERDRARITANQSKPRAQRQTTALTEVGQHFMAMIAVGARMAGAYLLALLLLFWHVTFIANLL